MNTSSLICYLPFHSSTTKDLCGNSWTAYGSPTIENCTLKTNGVDQYLECAEMPPVNELFNSDFTIHFYMTYRDSKTSEGGFFTFYSHSFSWQCYGSKARFNANCTINGSNKWLAIDSANLSEFKDAEHHFAITRKDDTLYFFLDGTLKKSYTVGTFTDTDTTLHIARRSNNRTALNMRDFCIHTEALWTENFTPPTDDEFFAAEIELAGFAERFIDADMSAQIGNVPLLNSATKVWLTADNYPTEDIAGNLWHAYNNPTSNGALQFTGVNQYVALHGGITLGGNDFTIRGKFNVNSASGSCARVFTVHQSMQTDANVIALCRNDTSTTTMRFTCMSSKTNFNCSHGVNHDFEVSYSFVDKIFRCFVDGVLVASKSNVTLNETTFANCWLGRSNYYGDGSFIGSIDDFQIIDGIALHTENFIPMTTAEIDALKADFISSYSTAFAIQNQIGNAPLTWRYENPGFASLILPSATTLNNLPATQSATSVAFYQTAQQKSFDCDPAKTIWIKFDLYHQGGNVFRVYSTSNGKTGIYRSSNTRIQLYVNGSAVLNIDNVLATNRLQTWLLRMTSDVNTGAIELWCDGVKCGEFFGNVNNGVDFSDIYLQSAGDKNLFSNVIVSNGELTFDDNVPHDVFNVEFNHDIDCAIHNYENSKDYCTAFTGKPDRARIPDAVFNSSAQFTIEVKIATADTHYNEYLISLAHIIGSYFNFNTGDGVCLTLSSGRVMFIQGDAQVGEGVDYRVLTNKFVADNNIHKITVRGNADTSLDILIDGELVSHVENYGASLKGGGYRGKWFANTGENDHFTRINLFEARFWDKALADDELFADIDGTEDNLRAWYLPTPEGLMDFSANMFHPTNQSNYFGRYFAVPNDFEYRIQNDALIWRYDDGVIYNGTGLPIKFHLPATYDLWARFDVTFDGVNHWYAFSGELDDMTGAIAASDTDIDYVADNSSVHTLTDVLIKHRAQSFLLHMKSGIVDGKIELWIQNVKQEIFTGNVNGGEPFIDFNLLCNGGTFFSNIIIANVSLEPEEIVRNLTQFTSYNTGTHTFYLNKGGSYPNAITYSVKNSVNHIREIDVEHINEIWAKFDATSDGVNRWWFYNDDGFGKNGITAQIDGSADFVADDQTVQSQTDAITLNQTQSYIVHMISGVDDGLIELRIKNGGTFTYTGNVNGGEAFDEIWLYSESRQVVFGNYILSTSPLNFDADIDVDVDGEPLNKIFFNVRHNGDVIKIPFVADESAPAVVIRWLKQNWYNALTSSGDIALRIGSATLALSGEL